MALLLLYGIGPIICEQTVSCHTITRHAATKSTDLIVVVSIVAVVLQLTIQALNPVSRPGSNQFVAVSVCYLSARKAASRPKNWFMCIWTYQPRFLLLLLLVYVCLHRHIAGLCWYMHVVSFVLAFSFLRCCCIKLIAPRLQYFCQRCGSTVSWRCYKHVSCTLSVTFV